MPYYERNTVYPVKGRTALDPLSGFQIPPEGKEVPLTQFWCRRINAGDVTLTKPSAKKTLIKKAAPVSKKVDPDESV